MYINKINENHRDEIVPPAEISFKMSGILIHNCLFCFEDS